MKLLRCHSLKEREEGTKQQMLVLWISCVHTTRTVIILLQSILADATQLRVHDTISIRMRIPITHMADNL